MCLEGVTKKILDFGASNQEVLDSATRQLNTIMASMKTLLEPKSGHKMNRVTGTEAQRTEIN